MPRFRYPGLNSFELEDRGVFFGRENEIATIFESVQLNHCTVLFGKSGIGKSSLLNAGILPRITKDINENKKDKRDFHVIRLRPGVWQKDENVTLGEKLKEASTIFTGGPSTNFLEFLPPYLKKSFWYNFKTYQFNDHSEDTKKTYLFIIDQLEEAFTYPSAQLEDALKEFIELQSQTLPSIIKAAVEDYERKNELLSIEENEVLYTPVPLKFVIAIRSDKLSLIVRLKKAIPNIFQNIHELLPLTTEQAMEAIIAPSIQDGTFLSPKFNVQSVSSFICSYLAEHANNDFESTLDAHKVEPFILQILCQHIEQKLVLGKKITSIGLEHLKDINCVIQNYYSNSLKELSLDAVLEERVRKLIEEEMIFEASKRRLSIYKELICKKLNIEEPTFIRIFKTRLFKEVTHGSEEYEISHDCLVVPILNAKKERIQEEEKLNEKFINSKSINNLDVVHEIKRALSKVPNDPSQYKKLGDYYYSNQDYRKALENYSSAIHFLKEPDLALYISRSNCLFILQRYEDANKDLFEVLKIHKESINVNYSIAYNFHLLNNLSQAIFHYKQTILIDQNHKEANYNLGLIFKHQKQYKEAIKFFKKVLILAPDFYDNYFSLIETMLIGRDDEQAHFYAKTAIDINTNNIEIYTKIGQIFYDQGRSEQSLPYFSEAVRRDSNKASLHGDFGQALYSANHLHRAIEQFELAVKYDDTNVYYHNWLGFIRVNLKDYNNALIAYRNAISLDPSSGYSWASVASCYKRLGDEDQYQAFVKKAKETKFKKWEREYAKACFEALCTDTDAALKWLKIALEKKQRSVEFIEHDIDFDFIKDDSRFSELLDNFKL